jgi:hypothetical protein
MPRVRSFKLLVFFWVLLLVGVALAEPKTATFPWSFKRDGLKFRVSNTEVTSTNANVLVHLFVLRETDKAAKELSWQSLFELETKSGQLLSCSSDCGVDSGNGLQISMGPVPLRDRWETRFMIYFNVNAADFPVRLHLPDDTLTAWIPRR